MIYGIKWTQRQKPSWPGATLEDATETVEKSKTFRSEGARDTFARRLEEKSSFVAVTDWWNEE